MKIIRVWDKNGSAENEFQAFKNNHQIIADLSICPKDGKWHNVIVTKDRLREKVFLDGKLLSQ